MSVMTKGVTYDEFPSIAASFDYTAVKPVLLPHFLPLISTIIPLMEREALVKCSKYFRESVRSFTESQTNCSLCQDWLLWVAFLALYERTLPEWLDVIQLISCASHSPVDTIFLLQYVGTALKIPTSDMIIPVLDCCLSARPSVEAAQFAVCYLLFSCEYSVDAGSFEDSIHMYVKQLVCMKRFDVNVTLASAFSSPLEHALALVIVTFFLSIGGRFLSQPGTIIPGMQMPAFIIVCYFLHGIAQNNEGDAVNLTRVLFLQQFDSLPDLIPGLLLLFDAFRDNDLVSEMISAKLRFIDPTFGSADLKELGGEALNRFQQGLHSVVPNVAAYFLVQINEVQLKISEDLMRIFEDRNPLMGQLNSNFMNKLRQSESELARLRRGDAKFWAIMMKHLATQNGGPWSQIVGKELHFKFDNAFDHIWRRNKMKLNWHFDDHRDASSMKDSGIESESREVRRLNMERSEDKIIDVPDVFSLELDCQMITPTRYFKGTLYLSLTSLAFEAKQTIDSFGELIDKAAKLIEIPIDSIEFVLLIKEMDKNGQNAALLFNFR
jgi:hypothetical protein